MKRIAVLGSGGNCSGMNAAIRAVVRSGLSNRLEGIGIQKGYQGLTDRHGVVLTTQSVSGRLQAGGTFLQSARCLEMLGLSCGAIVLTDLEEAIGAGRRAIDETLFKLAATLGI
jgi:6-phosphofructokinase